MEWVGTLGGPLIMIPASIARRWRGVNPYTQRAKTDPRVLSWFNSPEVDDYDRACSIKDDIGILEVGKGYALVLQTMGEPISWFASADGGVIVWVEYSDLDESGILEQILATPEESWESSGHQIRVGRGGLLVFDSVYAGDSLPTMLGEGATVPWMRLRLTPERYMIATARYVPMEGTRLTLHRLKRDHRKETDRGDVMG